MRRARVVALAAGGAVVVAAGISAAVLLSSGDDGSTPAAGPTAAATTAAGPAATSPADPLTPAQRALAATLGPLRVRDCLPAPTDRVTEPPGQGLGLDGGVDAAILCRTNVVAGEPGPAEVIARHYRDAATLKADADRRAGAINDVGSCAAGEPSTETWGRSTRQLGTFLCDRVASGAPDARFAVFWTVTADQTAFSAASTDPAGLIAWWRDFTKP